MSGVITAGAVGIVVAVNIGTSAVGIGQNAADEAAVEMQKAGESL